MQYQGGKSRIAKEIAFIIDKYNPSAPLVSLFCGGCYVEAAVHRNEIYCSDINRYVIEMWKTFQNGEFEDETSWPVFSEEEYYRIKSHPDENPALTALYAIGCSFGGKWWGGIARDKRKKCTILETAIKSNLKLAKNLKNVMFECCDYREAWIPEGAVVYCDPPYKETTAYSYLSASHFNTEEFWEYMRKLSQEHFVFISEKKAPKDFVSIWSKTSSTILNNPKSKGPVKTTEHLFVHKYLINKGIQYEI